MVPRRRTCNFFRRHGSSFCHHITSQGPLRRRNFFHHITRQAPPQEQLLPCSNGILSVHQLCCLQQRFRWSCRRRHTTRTRRRTDAGTAGAARAALQAAESNQAACDRSMLPIMLFQSGNAILTITLPSIPKGSWQEGNRTTARRKGNGLSIAVEGLDP